MLVVNNIHTLEDIVTGAGRTLRLEAAPTIANVAIGERVDLSKSADGIGFIEIDFNATFIYSNEGVDEYKIWFNGTYLHNSKDSTGILKGLSGGVMALEELIKTTKFKYDIFFKNLSGFANENIDVAVCDLDNEELIETLTSTDSNGNYDYQLVSWGDATLGFEGQKAAEDMLETMLYALDLEGKIYSFNDTDNTFIEEFDQALRAGAIKFVKDQLHHFKNKHAVD